MEQIAFSPNRFSCFLDTQKLLNKDAEAFYSSNIWPIESAFINVFSILLAHCKQQPISWKIVGTGSYFLNIFMEKKIDVTDIDTVIIANSNDYASLHWQLSQFPGVSIDQSPHSAQCTFRFLYLDIVLKTDQCVNQENQECIPYTLPAIDLTDHMVDLCYLKPIMLRETFKNIINSYQLITKPLNLNEQSTYTLVRIVKVLNFLDKSHQRANLIDQLLLDQNKIVLKKELDLFRRNKNNIKEKSLNKLGNCSSRVAQFNACLNIFLETEELSWRNELYRIFLIEPSEKGPPINMKVHFNHSKIQTTKDGYLEGNFSKNRTIISNKKYHLTYDPGHYLFNYEGTVDSNGSPHGKGGAKIANDDLYISGQFEHGKPKGIFKAWGDKKNICIQFKYRDHWHIDEDYVSTINFFKGRLFKGVINDRFLPKSGHLEYQNGDIFDGDFQDGLPSFGVKKYKNSEIFKGQFDQGNMVNGKLTIYLKNTIFFEYDGIFKNGQFQSGTVTKFNNKSQIFQITGAFNGQKILKGETYNVTWKDCDYMYTGPIIYQKIKGEVDQVYPDTPGGQFKRDNENAQKIPWTLSDMNFCIAYDGATAISDIILRKTENIAWWIGKNKDYTYYKTRIQSDDGHTYTLVKQCAKHQKILFTIEGTFRGDAINPSQLYTLTYPEEGWSYRGRIAYKDIPDNIEPYPMGEGISSKNNQSYFILSSHHYSSLSAVEYFEKNTEYPLITAPSKKNTATIPLISNGMEFAEVNIETCQIKSIHCSLYSIHGLFNGKDIWPNKSYVIRYNDGALFSGTVFENYNPLSGKFTGNYYCYEGPFLPGHQPKIVKKIIFNRIKAFNKIIDSLVTLTIILIPSMSLNMSLPCDTELACRESIIKIHTYWQKSSGICLEPNRIFKDYVLLINAIKPLLDPVYQPNDATCLDILNACIMHIRSIRDSLATSNKIS
jgi:hypothetical protein